MAVKELYLLSAGFVTTDQSWMTYRMGMGQKVNIPIMMVLVKTDDGSILLDTGLNPHALEDPIGIYGEFISSNISFNAEDDVRSRLKELDLTPDNIRYVVNSHLHWDHTGGNQFFTKSKIVVQKAEYRFALYPDSFAASPYLKNHFDYPLDYQLVEGDMELVPGVSLFTAPGHTPGLQGMVVYLPESRPFIFPSDSIPTKENIEKNVPNGSHYNNAQTMETMNRIVDIAKREKGRLILTHDPYAWDTLKPAPYRYR